MNAYFDNLDTQSANTRERRLFDALPGFLRHAVDACPGIAQHLSGIEVSNVRGRDALSRLPVLRKSVLMQAQSDNPPFGGFVRKDALTGARVFMSPGPVWEPQVSGSDPWQAARAL